MFLQLNVLLPLGHKEAIDTLPCLSFTVNFQSCSKRSKNIPNGALFFPDFLVAAVSDHKKSIRLQ